MTILYDIYFHNLSQLPPTKLHFFHRCCFVAANTSFMIIPPHYFMAIWRGTHFSATPTTAATARQNTAAASPCWSLPRLVLGDNGISWISRSARWSPVIDGVVGFEWLEVRASNVIDASGYRWGVLYLTVLGVTRFFGRTSAVESHLVEFSGRSWPIAVFTRKWIKTFSTILGWTQRERDTHTHIYIDIHLYIYLYLYTHKVLEGANICKHQLFWCSPRNTRFLNPFLAPRSTASHSSSVHGRQTPSEALSSEVGNERQRCWWW